jgi:hypothetical protein
LQREGDPSINLIADLRYQEGSCVIRVQYIEPLPGKKALASMKASITITCLDAAKGRLYATALTIGSS